MRNYWRILPVVIGVTFATASSAGPTTIDQTCAAADAAVVQGDTSATGSTKTPPFDDPACASADVMSGTEKALCLMLLGCTAVIGNQASRRKAIRAVAS